MPKTDDVIVATINHALAWVDYSDIHFQLDWYFHEVNLDFFCNAQTLVMPTYFHVGGTKHVHASVLLSELKFKGLVFLVELPDSPSATPFVRRWTGAQRLYSTGDLAFAWLLDQGYRDFESYGIGGTGYADYYVSETYVKPETFRENTDAHVAHIMERIKTHNATWVRN